MSCKAVVPRIAFLGFGEAAYYMTLGFAEEGLTGVKAYDKLQDVPGLGDRIRERARDAKVQLVPNVKELADGVDVVFSSVVSAAAVQAAKAIAPYLTEHHVFVDTNAASPITKKQVAQVIEPSGASFVDAAIMNPVPTYRHKVSMLISGRGAQVLRSKMTPFGMNFTVVEGGPGAASSIKMLRSVFMKGMAALLIETLVAAYKLGTHELVVESIKETLGKISPDALIQRLIGGTAIHAGRRVHEMEEVIETLNSIHVKPAMSAGTKEVLSWVESLGLGEVFHGEVPERYEEALKAMVTAS